MSAVDIVALWVGWLLVWALGVSLLLALRGKSALAANPGEMPFVVGGGWLIGQFALTLWMRVLAFAGVRFGVAAIAVPVALMATVAGFVAWRRHGRMLAVRLSGSVRTLRGDALSNARRVLWFALLGWLALRFALLLSEALRRPLYPWDAWTQWATKARVWYGLKTMVPFGSEATWLSSPPGTMYFDAAPGNPATVPLTQVWSAMLVGRWADALINLPWWLTLVALGLALYGFFRRQSMGPLGALLGAWLVVSLPMLDAHVALAGYPDLALSSYLTIAALSSLQFVRSRDAGDLLLAMTLGVACFTVERFGGLWVLALIPGIIASWFPRHGLRVAGACLALAAATVLVLDRMPLDIGAHPVRLAFDMRWSDVRDAYFAFANWHALFYGALAVALLGRRHLPSRELAPLTIVVAGGAAFLLFLLAFPDVPIGPDRRASVNIATLPLAPLIAVWTIMTFRAWSRDSGAASATGTSPVAAT